MTALDQSSCHNSDDQGDAVPQVQISRTAHHADAGPKTDPAPLHDQIDRMCALSIIRHIYGPQARFGSNASNEQRFPKASNK